MAHWGARAFALLAVATTHARADDTLPVPKPAPYSIPWQLRPAAILTVARLDSVVASFEDATGASGVTAVSMLSGSYPLNPQIAAVARLGVLHLSPPQGASGDALANPALGAVYLVRPEPHTRVLVSAGFTLPVGSGGGNDPDPESAAAVRSGVLARSGMDNTMFAVNDFAFFPGVGVAYVRGGWTVHAEATLLALFRVRGEDVQPDKRKLNSTAGIHVGYFVHPSVSLGAELRHQRWLSTPKAVADDMTGTLRETSTMAIGARFHIRTGFGWIRPGIAYARGLDAPMTSAGYQIVQIDVPVFF